MCKAKFSGEPVVTICLSIDSSQWWFELSVYDRAPTLLPGKNLSLFFVCLLIVQIFGMAEKEMEYRVELFNK